MVETNPDRLESPDVDPKGVPWEFPTDMDTSGWLEEMPGLLETYDDTASNLWRLGKSNHEARDVRAAFMEQIHVLIQYVSPNGSKANNTTRYLRRIHYPLFARFYGHNFAPYRDPKDPSGPVCPKQHLEVLTRAARAVEKQLGIYESAEWAAQNAPVVANLGWDTIKPEEVPGTAALGLLQNAVKDMPGFYEKVLSKYTQKPKEKGKTAFKDDGSEQIEYAAKLAGRVGKKRGVA
jgi:hypothetical protein